MAKKKRTTKQRAKPQPGDAFAFPLEDGRFAVCRVLRKQPDGPGVLAACSEWIGDKVPPADDPALRPILHPTHHSHYGRPKVLWISGRVPDDFIPIGTIEPSEDERQFPCSSYGDWGSIACQPLMQWQWDHDREQVLADDLLEEEEELAEDAATEQIRRDYLQRVTLEDLLKETFFTNWKEFFAAAAIRKSRKILRDTIRRLIELGADADEPTRVSVLRQCIESFNKLDAELEFIDTEARMDIYAEFEAIAHASNLADHAVELFKRCTW